MDFPFLAGLSLFQTRIEIHRGDIQHNQPDVQASIFIDAEVMVDQHDQAEVYVPEKRRLAMPRLGL